MKIGVVFPQTEFGNDPAAIYDYAQMAEALGYGHILAYDHVLGVNPDREPRLQGPYTYEDPFHEPFVLFSFMAGATHLSLNTMYNGFATPAEHSHALQTFASAVL